MKNKNNNIKKQILGNGENLIFRATLLLDSNVQFNETLQGIQRNRKYGPFKGKNKSTKIIPEKDLRRYILDKRL